MYVYVCVCAHVCTYAHVCVFMSNFRMISKAVKYSNWGLSGTKYISQQ